MFNYIIKYDIFRNGIFLITTLIISKKPRNTGKLRDRDTEFTTDLLHSDRALTRCSFPWSPPTQIWHIENRIRHRRRRSLFPLGRSGRRFLHPKPERRQPPMYFTSGSDRAFEPVSYTHLDVYKRQLIKWKRLLLLLHLAAAFLVPAMYCPNVSPITCRYVSIQPGCLFLFFRFIFSPSRPVCEWR